MKELPINIDSFNEGKVLTINIKINNIDAIFLLDTGASSSIIDLRKLYKYTSTKPVKTMNISSISNYIDTYQINIKNFKIGYYNIKNIIINVADLINLNNTFSTNNIKIIDGILGNDIIFKIISSIDIENKKIILK